MLSKTVFKEQMRRMLGFYPNWGIKSDDPDVMKDWYEMFKTFDDVQFIDTVATYIVKESYPPSVAGLMAHRQASKLPPKPVEVIIE